MRIAAAMLCALGALGGSDIKTPPITVVLQTTGPAAPQTLAELKAELQKVMRDSGVVLRFYEGPLRSGEVFHDVIVVRLRGRCEMDTAPVTFDERGPEGLAFTHSSDGRLLPFAEVPCDRVRAAIRPALWGEDYRRAPQLLGRALGRIISHEFYHILARTQTHGRRGIAQHSLSADQLIADQLRLDAPDANLIRMRSLPPVPPASDLP